MPAKFAAALLFAAAIFLVVARYCLVAMASALLRGAERRERRGLSFTDGLILELGALALGDVLRGLPTVRASRPPQQRTRLVEADSASSRSTRTTIAPSHRS